MVEFNTTVPKDRIDPHVKLPTSIANASAAIDAFYAAQAEGRPVEPPGVPVPIDPPVPPPQPDPAPPQPTPQPDPPPPAPPEPQPEPTPDEPVPTPQQIQGDEWANRYNAMRGRLGAETKKFNAAIATKDQQILDLHNKLSQLSDEVVKSNQLLGQLNRQPSQPPAPVTPLITDEDLERHGADTVDFVQRAARAMIGPELERVQHQNEELQQELSRNRRAAMNAELTLAVPNWREINVDKRFLQWLRKPNIYTGRTNKELLNAAAAAADAPRVAAFFKGFLSEEKVTGHQPDPAAPVPPVAPRKAAVDLASLAAPGSGKPASGTDMYTPPSKPTYKTTDFERFRRDKAKGRYTAAQAGAIEADMHAATLEGRIIKG
jgi:hypothetical protein